MYNLDSIKMCLRIQFDSAFILWGRGEEQVYKTIYQKLQLKHNPVKIQKLSSP